jgi:hypothetical protein
MISYFIKVLEKSMKNVLLTLLGIARLGMKKGLKLVPQLVRFEAEIDALGKFPSSSLFLKC